MIDLRSAGLGFAAALMLFACPAQARDDLTIYQSDAAFEDVVSDVDNAIINLGYVVDYRGRIGEMLQRTAADVGATKALYRNAEFLQFCSAVVSREVMEQNIANIAYCPYIVFVYETEDEAGTVNVGFRRLPDGEGRDKVNELLVGIAREAAGQ
jgi:uncharacterized protein (DUF302 family)